MVSDGVMLTYDEDRIQVAPLLFKQMGLPPKAFAVRKSCSTYYPDRDWLPPTRAGADVLRDVLKYSGGF
jgi:hypothetical protein